MLVIGFDPGSALTGFGVVSRQGNRLHHREHGTIRTPAKQHSAQRLQTLFQEAEALIARIQPDAVAIERLFFKQNVTTGIQVAQARGVLLLAAAQAGCPIGEFSPTEMKIAVTGYGRADKKQLQEMVRRLLNLSEVPRPDDAADALALAICQIQFGATQERLQAEP